VLTANFDMTFCTVFLVTIILTFIIITIIAVMPDVRSNVKL